MNNFTEDEFALESGSIHYKLRFISEPVFVFIYGGMGDINQSTWNNLIGILPHNLSVLTFDRPGIGLSKKSSLSRTAENIASEVKSLLDYLKFSKYVIIGHSMGGLYARYLACKYPDNIIGLVLLDATHEDQLIRGSKFYDAKVLKESIKYANQNLEGLIVPDDPDKSFEQMRQFKLLPANIKSIIAVAEKSLPEQVLNADKLNELNILLQKELSATSSFGKFHQIKDSSHFIYIDQPEITANLILSYY